MRIIVDIKITTGTCQLRLHASGKWTEEHVFAIDLAPNAIRNMFGRVIEECVEQWNEGGYITKNLDRVVQWVLSQDSVSW